MSGSEGAVGKMAFDFESDSDGALAAAAKSLLMWSGNAAPPQPFFIQAGGWVGGLPSVPAAMPISFWNQLSSSEDLENEARNHTIIQGGSVHR